MKVVLSQLTCLYQLPHVIGVSVMSVIRLLSACQSGAGLLWQHSGKPTRLAGIIVPLPHGNVFCRAVRERLGLCHRHRGRRRRHGEGKRAESSTTKVERARRSSMGTRRQAICSRSTIESEPSGVVSRRGESCQVVPKVEEEEGGGRWAERFGLYGDKSTATSRDK